MNHPDFKDSKAQTPASFSRRSVAVSLAAMAAGLPAFAQTAAGFPSRPIKFIVPFPAGSATDNIARVMAKGLQDELGQPIVVDNRAGAQGMLGAEAAAHSAADGYTLLVAAVSFAAAPSMFKKVSFDPKSDFTTVGRFATTSLVLMVRADFPAKNLKEFISHVKSQPGKLSGAYGSSSSQICIAQLSSLANLDVLSVPYKGIPLAVNDLLGGVVQFSFVDLGNAIAQAKGGRLRPLAITSARRSPLVPDWPTLAETLHGFDIDSWIALFGPKGLPTPVVQRLHEATSRALAQREVQASLQMQGFAPAPMTAAESTTFLRSEVDKWARLSKQAGIEPE